MAAPLLRGIGFLRSFRNIHISGGNVGPCHTPKLELTTHCGGYGEGHHIKCNTCSYSRVRSIYHVDGAVRCLLINTDKTYATSAACNASTNGVQNRLASPLPSVNQVPGGHRLSRNVSAENTRLSDVAGSKFMNRTPAYT